MARTRTLLAVAGGFLAGVIVVSVGVVGGVLEPAADDEDPMLVAAELVTAYQRSRDATYVVEGEWRRFRGDEQGLSSAALVAQRPPDRIQRQLGAVEGTLGGRTVNCSTDVHGEFSCASSTEAPMWEDDVAGEVGALWSYVSGPTRLYGVTRGTQGCFELAQVRAYPDPPYGSSATMCFDDATGALTVMERRRENGVTDRFEAVTVRPLVTPDDLRVDDDEKYRGEGVPTEGDVPEDQGATEGSADPGTTGDAGN